MKVPCGSVIYTVQGRSNFLVLDEVLTVIVQILFHEKRNMRLFS